MPPVPEDQVESLTREVRIMLAAGKTAGEVMARLIEAGLNREQADAVLSMVQHGQAPGPTVVWQISTPGWFAGPGDNYYDRRGQRPERAKVSEGPADTTLEFPEAVGYSRLTVRHTHRDWFGTVLLILICLPLAILFVLFLFAVLAPPRPG